MRFIKTITPPDLWAQKFYTLKVRKLHLFLLRVKHPKYISISRCSKKLTDGVKLFKKTRSFMEKTYTAGTNFTQTRRSRKISSLYILHQNEQQKTLH